MMCLGVCGRVGQLAVVARVSPLSNDKLIVAIIDRYVFSTKLYKLYANSDLDHRSITNSPLLQVCL